MVEPAKITARTSKPQTGEPLPHESAKLHVTGEALYTDEVMDNGQRKRVPRRKLEDWEEAGVAKEHFHGWDK